MMLRFRQDLSLAALGLLVVLLLGLVGATQPARAESTVGPFYNPHTKSYFALVNRHVMQGKNWDKTARMAAARTFKGVAGRLAVVDDAETHLWLRNTFKDDLYTDAWIGLRYFCNSRKLLWVDGKIMKQSPPGVWHPRWHRTNVMCGRIAMDYMGVYYTSAGMAWQASGQEKFFTSYFVEFPTGGP